MYPTPVGKVLEASLDRMGIIKKARRFQVFYLWPSVVGDVAKHAKPRRLDGDTLYVATSSSVWAQELTLMCKGIISRINKALGGEYIKEIRFSEHLWGATNASYGMDARNHPGKQYKRFMANDVLTWAEKQRIASLVCPSKDPRLSFVFQRFIVTMEKRAKYLLEKGFVKCSECGYIYKLGRKCPLCETKKRFKDYNLVVSILEKHPETSYLTISAITDVKDKYVFERARQNLDAKWFQVIRNAYFRRTTYGFSAQEQEDLRRLFVKLVSLRTQKPQHQLTQKDFDKILGKKFTALLGRRSGRKRNY